MAKSGDGKGGPKRKQPKISDIFQILRDLQPGERIPLVPPPPLFASHFRIGRQAACRSFKRYAILREGYLYIYADQQNANKNRVWRSVDLAKSTISYRPRDKRILFQITDTTYRLKVRKADFQQWIDNFRTHRLYGQAIVRAKEVAETEPAQAQSSTTPVTPAAPITVTVGLASSETPAKPIELTAVVTSHNDTKQPVTLKVEPKKSAAQPSHVISSVVTPKQEPIIKPKHNNPIGDSSNLKTTDTRVPPKAPVPVTVEIFTREVEPPRPLPPTPPVPSPKPTLPVERPPQESVKEVSAPRVQSSHKDEEPKDKEPTEETPSSSDSKKQFVHGPIEGSRTKLPVPMNPPPSLFRLIMSAMGKNIMHMSLPATVMEPLSTLQVLCEELEYSSLIDMAVNNSDPEWRMIYVSAFAMSRYGSTTFRAGRKPFNPLLGETFEYVHPELGWRCVAEQVSHHPPISALYAEGRGWQLWHDVELIASLGGNSAKVTPSGPLHLRLEKWNETYKWNKVVTQVTGILSGSYVIDNVGEMIINCRQSELKCKLNFKKSTKRGDVEGQVLDDDDIMLHVLQGNWTDSLRTKTPEEKSIWRLAPMPADYEKYYGFTSFAMSLNEMRPDVHGLLPKTDSRYRPDQRALEMGRPDEADKLKKGIEDRQRQRRKALEAAKGSHVPLWFKTTGSKTGSTTSRWKFTGKYWQSKKGQFKDIEFLDLW